MGRFKLTKIKLKDLAPIILVMFLLFVSIACANMLIPSYGVIHLELGIPEALVAIPDSGFLLTSASFALIWGYFTDRIDRTKVIIVGAFSWTFGMMLTGFSSSFIILLISRMISGIGLGCVIPVGYSIISDAIPPDERSGWFGTLAILSSLSNGSGQALSSFIGPVLGWRFPFFLLSGISIAIVCVLFFVKIPQRGASESELSDLVELHLEYSYKISKKDLGVILMKKTNKYLIIQGFFAIIPGTLFVYFMTSMLSTHYFTVLPSEIRLQTAAIFAGLLGIGYLLGNAIMSYVGDILFRKNKRNRTRVATACMALSIPFIFLTLVFIQPVSSKIITNLSYPSPIPPGEITKYIFLTIFEIFKVSPNYIYYFIFGFIGAVLSTGWVSNKNAVMVDVNLPEHKGTATSFFSLAEQVGKGVTLLLSFTLISLFGSVINMMYFAVFLWVPSAILWILVGRSVETDMEYKTTILSERKQVNMLEFIFELEIQMDRATQKVQDSKYYILSNHSKFNKLLDDAIAILSYCEKEGEFRSITKIEKRARDMNIKATSIKNMANQIFKILELDDLSAKEIDMLNEDLRQIILKIAEGERSTFGDLQIYYEDAYLKIVEARLLRKNDLFKSMEKVLKAVKIYERVKNLLSERLQVILDNSELSKEDKFVYDKEQELLEKCSKALVATTSLKEEFEGIFKKLEENGISEKDLEKISELTLEYNIDLYTVIMDTFGQDRRTKETILEVLNEIDAIFNEYDKLKESELKVF
ncbi:MAG: MFS transporter [Candidatus Lokiarchaeota archaeon]|nr:MFS transporter [Candidatus Lokiarchaeota archaeon]